jgi:iron complex transport system substrate-binding protein
MEELRIASLVPSATDLVAALGLESALVGVSHECDHPIARDRPVLTSSGIDAAPEKPPAEVDRQVSEAVRAGRPLYVTDAEALRALSPTLVLAQDVCDVCAVSSDEAGEVLPPGARLLRLSATSVDTLYADLRALGGATGRTGEAEAVVEEVRARLEAVRAAVRGAPVRPVLSLEWGDPPFSAGHWVPELLAIAGGRDVRAERGAASRRLTPEEVETARADVLLYLPCGYGVDEAAEELARLPLAPAIGARWALDANRLLSRCTPVVARAAEVLAGVLHPERVDPPPARDARRVDSPVGAATGG